MKKIRGLLSKLGGLRVPVLKTPVPLWLFALYVLAGSSLVAYAAVPLFTGSVAVPSTGSETQSQLTASECVGLSSLKVFTNTNCVYSIAGTANQIAASAAAGSVTMSLVSPIDLNIVNVNSLTASALVATDASKNLTSTVSGLSPTLTGLTLSGLTASLPICTTAAMALSSTCTGLITNADLANSSLTIAGTTNQVNVSGCGPVSLGGTCTLSLPQSINSGAAPTFAGTNFTAIPNGALSNSSLTIAGTANRVTVSGCSPVSLGGTCTLSGPQDLGTGSSPTFAAITITGNTVSSNGVFTAGSGVTPVYLCPNLTCANGLSITSAGVATFLGSSISATGTYTVGSSSFGATSATVNGNLTAKSATINATSGGSVLFNPFSTTNTGGSALPIDFPRALSSSGLNGIDFSGSVLYDTGIYVKYNTDGIFIGNWPGSGPFIDTAYFSSSGETFYQPLTSTSLIINGGSLGTSSTYFLAEDGPFDMNAPSGSVDEWTIGGSPIAYANGSGFNAVSPAFTSVPSATAGATFLCLNLGTVQSGATCAASTERVKMNIAPLTYARALHDLMLFRPKTWCYKPKYYGGLCSQSLIAEEANAVSPRYADREKNGKPYALRTDATEASLIKVVQQQHKDINDLRYLVDRLEHRAR